MSVTSSHLICPECGTKVQVYSNPFPTVDVIVRYQGGVALIKRKNPPFGWAIPGGFVDYGESTQDTATREMIEETGLKLDNLKLFTVRSEPNRDPRCHTVTVVYSADGIGTPIAGDDAVEVQIYQWNQLPDEMAFDHRDVLEEYLRSSL